MRVRIAVLSLVLAPAAAFVGCQAQRVPVRVSEAPATMFGGGGARARKVVAKKPVKRAAKKVVTRSVSRPDAGKDAVDGYLAKSAAELFTPENRVPAAVGAAILVGQLSQPLVVGLERLGLIKLPPLNALTSIANAAMEAEIEAGGIPKVMGTAWVQGFYKDLIAQYNAAPDGFLQAYCDDAAHAAWCTADTVVAALQAASQ